MPDERCYFGCADEEPFHKLLEIPAPYLRIPQLCRMHSSAWRKWKRDLDRDTKWPDDFWPFVDNTLAALAAEKSMPTPFVPPSGEFMLPNPEPKCSTCGAKPVVGAVDAFFFCDTCDANLALAADGREGADDETTYGAFVRQWVADRTGVSPGPRGAEKVKRVRTAPRESTILAMSCTPGEWYRVPSGEIAQFKGVHENKAWFLPAGADVGDMKNFRQLSTAEKVVIPTPEEREGWIAEAPRVGVEATTSRESALRTCDVCDQPLMPPVLSVCDHELCSPCADDWEGYVEDREIVSGPRLPVAFEDWREDRRANLSTPSEPVGLGVHFSSESVEWGTPQDFFDKLNMRWQFGLDVCATPKNAKCDRYFTKDDDGLAQEWTGACWMNPPYGRGIGAWVAKARASAKTGKAAVVCLVPARTDTAWWWDNVNAPDGTIVASGANFETGLRWIQWSSGLVVGVTEVRGRLKFENPEREESWQAPFPSATVAFYLAPLPK